MNFGSDCQGFKNVRNCGKIYEINKNKMLFQDEGDALGYLQRSVPEKRLDETPNLDSLQQSLFEIPDNATEGCNEFEGPNGYKVSFTLAKADDKYDDCWEVYRDLLQRGDVEGNIRPIFAIRDITIRTPHGYHNLTDYESRTEVIWMPGLHSVTSKLSYANVRIEQRKLYLTGITGFFSRPQDLLTYFHEFGHVETRSPSDMQRESDSIRVTIDGTGVKGEPNKNAAYVLQREKDANEWMYLHLKDILRDLGVSAEQIREYIDRVQLESYYEASRRRIARALVTLAETAPLTAEEADALLYEGGEAFNSRRREFPKWEVKLTEKEVMNLACAGINLQDAVLPNKSFRSCTLASANFRSANLSGSRFVGCDLTHASFEDATIKECSIQDSNLSGMSFNGARTRGGKLYVTGSNLQGADLENAQIVDADFQNVQLQNARLGHATLSGSLDGVDMSGASGAHAVFDSSTIINSSFQGADLPNVSFHSSRLDGCNLSNAQLTNAVMCRAVLSGSDLTNADLRGADLRDADFRDATLTGVNLDGANTEGALGLDDM